MGRGASPASQHNPDLLLSVMTSRALSELLGNYIFLQCPGKILCLSKLILYDKVVVAACAGMLGCT